VSQEESEFEANVGKVSETLSQKQKGWKYGSSGGGSMRPWVQFLVEGEGGTKDSSSENVIVTEFCLVATRATS
jgi:hypothetical protein